jgi:hypothetical protein
MAKFIVKTTGQFGKDLKLAKKRGLDLNDLFAVALILPAIEVTALFTETSAFVLVNVTSF